jgi:hypothetical protein
MSFQGVSVVLTKGDRLDETKGNSCEGSGAHCTYIELGYQKIPVFFAVPRLKAKFRAGTGKSQMEDKPPLLLANHWC